MFKNKKQKDNQKDYQENITRKSFWSKIEIPKTQTNRNLPFSFEIYNWKIEGLIFLLTAFVVPFIFLIILRFAFGMGTTSIDVQTNSFLQLAYILINTISVIVGMVFFWQRDKELLIKSGLIVFYLFQMVPSIFAFVGSLILTLIFAQDVADNPVSNILALWFQIIGEIVVIVLALKWTVDLKLRIIQTFKKDWKLLLIVVLIGILLMVFICVFLYSWIFSNTILGEQSQNQEILEKFIHHSNLFVRIFYILSLLVLTSFVAPLAEELASRNAWYIGIGNRNLAWITSAMFFGMMHVSAGDVEHILNYFIAGLILSTIFSISRGNVTYNWLVHAGYNTITFIIILA